MRTLLIALSVVAASVVAPSTPAPILGSVDFPVAGSTLPRDAVYIGGWVFRSDAGGYPDSMVVGFYNLDTGTMWPLSGWAVVRSIYRPDVRAALSPPYPVGDYSGYALMLTPSQQPPAGHWHVIVLWADADGGTWTDVRTITITE